MILKANCPLVSLNDIFAFKKNNIQYTYQAGYGRVCFFANHNNLDCQKVCIYFYIFRQKEIHRVFKVLIDKHNIMNF